MKTIIKTFIILLLLSALYSCGKEKTYPTVGSQLPEFSVTMNDSTVITSARLSMGRSLLVFFHTQCPDCIRELETMQPFYDKYHDSVEIVLISRAERDEDIRSFWKTNGYTMPYSAQEDRAVYELFSDYGIPYVVLSINGVIKKTWNDKVLFNEGEYIKALEE